MGAVYTVHCRCTDRQLGYQRETIMKRDDIKVGDSIKATGTGYLSTTHRQDTVTSVTKTKIVCGNVKYARTDGCMMPRSKYVNFYITSVNGEKVD